MNRRLLGATLTAGLLIPTGAFAATTHSDPARPNPGLTPITPDYVNPLPAKIVHLEPGVIQAALADQKYLTFEKQDDLGGFEPASVGSSALSSGGHTIVGTTPKTSQIPNYAQAAGGRVNSFAFTGGTTPPPTTAKQAVPGLTPPPNNNLTPPPNQGFGGTTPTPTQPGTTTTSGGIGATTTSGGGATTPGETTTSGSPSSGTTTGSGATTSASTTPTPPPTASTSPTATSPTTTPGATTPAKTTTEPAKTTTTPRTITVPPVTTPITVTTTPVTTTSPPVTTSPTTPGGTSCGTTGLLLNSDQVSCNIAAYNMAPGGSISETLTIQNQSGGPVTLSLEASGLTNPLWDDLELAVWTVGSAAPDPFPPLSWWTTQYNALQTLADGQTVQYEVELYLPTTAGNADQGQTASVNLSWNAAG